MALLGAEILFYPTAIGSEPQDLSIDSRDHWQRAMQGHAASNIMPVVASNRIGTERGERWEVTYYGSSFITDHSGAIAAQARARAKRSSPRRSTSTRSAPIARRGACSAIVARRCTGR